MVSAAADEGILVDVRGVTFGFGGPPVLLDVSFAIRRGDFLALIGPNGSGKTTLVKIILGLLRPDRGEVTIMGEPAARFKVRQKIGYVPQKATNIDPIFPASVREVVAMAVLSHRKTLGMTKKKSETAIAGALRQVGMEDFGRAPVASLSGGQQQRVFIARALVTRPEILFLDEPTTGVDAPTQDRFYGMLDDLNKKEGMTIVLVTHDIGIVDRHISQVACLNQRLVYHGTHDEFCRRGVLENMLSGGHHLVSHEH
jgi:zinc transport system ATP-binding protein